MIVKITKGKVGCCVNANIISHSFVFSLFVFQALILRRVLTSNKGSPKKVQHECKMISHWSYVQLFFEHFPVHFHVV